MNLFERLKPEYKEILEFANTKFPALVGYICDNLNEYEYIKDVPYGVIVDLKFLLKNPTSPYELFYEI